MCVVFYFCFFFFFCFWTLNLYNKQAETTMTDPEVRAAHWNNSCRPVICVRKPWIISFPAPKCGERVEHYSVPGSGYFSRRSAESPPLFPSKFIIFSWRVELGRLERQAGWAEPRLKPPFSGIHVHLRQCSLCLSGLRTVTLKSYEGELNADGCGDFNEYKLAEYC